MNSRTAKLIRKYSSTHNYRPRLVRKLWNKLPRTLRHQRRLILQKQSQP